MDKTQILLAMLIEQCGSPAKARYRLKQAAVVEELEDNSPFSQMESRKEQAANLRQRVLNERQREFAKRAEALQVIWNREVPDTWNDPFFAKLLKMELDNPAWCIDTELLHAGFIKSLYEQGLQNEVLENSARELLRDIREAMNE